MILFALALATATSAVPVNGNDAAATVMIATPTNAASVIAAAAPGSTVRLIAGTYPVVAVKNRSYDPPITVDASAATLAGIQSIAASGIRWIGGTIKGLNPTAGGANYGFYATQSRNITVEGFHISDFRVGIVFDRVSGGTVTGNWVSRMTSDGIDFAASRNLTITRNTCTDFSPASGSHPDCIQLWSSASLPPTADVTITGNSAVGAMQGISLFNHVSDGVDAGGFDRVRVENNSVLITYADGIVLQSCRACTLRNNSVNSLPNYIYKAQLYATDGSVEVCGNAVPMVPREASGPCLN